MVRSRRSVLCATAAALMLSGCEDSARSRDAQVDGYEVVAINETEAQRTLIVQIKDGDGQTVLRHAYSLKPGYADQSKSVETDLNGGTVSLSESEFGTVEEQFLPQTHPENPHSDVPVNACGPMDIIVGVKDHELYVTYGC